MQVAQKPTITAFGSEPGMKSGVKSPVTLKSRGDVRLLRKADMKIRTKLLLALGAISLLTPVAAYVAALISDLRIFPLPSA
ncbi:MAG: hypothetical protein DMG53_16255 [Acidobacteria bacterium]|nr:MAG: hypothetical protein DMG53_16255 [Acidobacteriota bacterium]PYU72196.1 MAG: hypothetical protein DMG52_19200 [Acidobacteriota bacterium]